jgi:molecular chaperone DnaK
MSVDRSQVAYLIIEEIHSKERIKYELGDLIAEMFPGFILRDNRNGDSA